MTRPARLAVGVLSAGRVGAVIGAALMRAGHSVVAASGISTASVNRAEDLLPGVPLRPADEVARAADLVLLALPDDVLPAMVNGLAATGSLRAGQIIVHTSGAHGVDVLAPAAEVGALPLALHPAMTFTGRPEDLERLATCVIGVTAGPEDEAGWLVGEALAMEMGAEPVRVPESARALYHAALAHGANHLATLVNDCVTLLRDAGVDSPERMIGPLLSAALDNSLRRGDSALTGPVARGDVGTVAKHRAVLGSQAPDISASYDALARRTVARAGDAGLIDDTAAADLIAQLDRPADGRENQ